MEKDQLSSASPGTHFLSTHHPMWARSRSDVCIVGWQGSLSYLFFQTGQYLASSYMRQVGFCSQPISVGLPCFGWLPWKSKSGSIESRPSQGCQWHLSGGALGVDWTKGPCSCVPLQVFLCFFSCMWVHGSSGCLPVKLCKSSMINHCASYGSRNCLLSFKVGTWYYQSK